MLSKRPLAGGVGAVLISSSLLFGSTPPGVAGATSEFVVVSKPDQCVMQSRASSYGTLTAIICPRDVPIPANYLPPADTTTSAQTQPDFMGTALFNFSCGAGAACYAYDFMSPGYVRHDWYEKYPGGSPFLTNRYTAVCTAPLGCVELGWEDPPYPYSVTTEISYGIAPSPAWIEPLLCWCENGSHNCSYL